MIKTIFYIKFLLQSTNHHGVHSPFVFDYLTKCLYKKPRLSKNRVENVILKSVSYFKFKNVCIENIYLKNKLHFLKFESPYDIVVFENLQLNVLLKFFNKEWVHNGTLVIVPDLRNQQVEWKKTIAHPKITVSMDCFSLGLLFIRKEQIKEHFTIRL